MKGDSGRNCLTPGRADTEDWSFEIVTTAYVPQAGRGKWPEV
jgi:hypothetical protein